MGQTTTILKEKLCSSLSINNVLNKIEFIPPRVSFNQKTARQSPNPTPNRHAPNKQPLCNLLSHIYTVLSHYRQEVNRTQIRKYVTKVKRRQTNVQYDKKQLLEGFVLLFVFVF